MGRIVGNKNGHFVNDIAGAWTWTSKKLLYHSQQSFRPWSLKIKNWVGFGAIRRDWKIWTEHRDLLMGRGRQWVGWANQSAAQIPKKVAGHVDFPCLGVSGSEACPGGSFVGHMVFAGVWPVARHISFAPRICDNVVHYQQRVKRIGCVP